MRDFPIEAKVQRVVVDTVSLVVQAKNEGSALKKAESFLINYPETDSTGIPIYYIENRENLSSEVLDVSLVEEALNSG